MGTVPGLEESLGVDLNKGESFGESNSTSNSRSNSFIFNDPAIDEWNQRASQINKEIDQEWIDYKNFQPSTAKPYGYFDSGGQWQDATRSDSGVWMTPDGSFAMPTIYAGPEKPREYLKIERPAIGTSSYTESESKAKRGSKQLDRPIGSGEPRAPRLDMDITASDGNNRKVISTFNEYEINSNITGAINGGDLPRLLGQTNTRGETIPTMEIKTKDANGNIRAERVSIDKVNAIYFDQMMDIVEQAQNRGGSFDWNKQSYKDKLREQMGLWGLDYNDNNDRTTIESQLRFVAESKPLVTKNATGQWNYTHMNGSTAPYDMNGTDKTYTVGYVDPVTNEFKQLELDGNSVRPYDPDGIKQAIRNSNENTRSAPSLSYTVAPRKNIIRDTFYNGLIPFTMKMLTKQNIAGTTTLDISNTPRAREDITKGLAIIMYRYGLNRIYGRRGR